MSEEFYSVVTDYGIQKQLSCLKNTEEFDLSQIVLGDGSGNYYEPDTSQTELVNEVWRGEITKCVWENGKFYCLTSVPADESGFYIREAGVLDSAGNLIVVSKFPETYKQTPDSGSVKQLIIKIEINFLNSSVSSLAVNANISYATQTEVETINSSKANIDLDNLSEAGEARFDSKLDCSIAVTYAIQFTNGNFATTDTSAPDAVTYNGQLVFNGSDNAWTGIIENVHNSSNQIYTQMSTRRIIDDTAYSSYVRSVVDSSGNAYAQCPTYTDYTDSSTKIATTAFVKNVLSASGKGFATYSKAANGYIKFVNGIIFQWGTTTLSINSTTTVTFPTAFTSTNYVINANFFASANIDDNPIPYASSTSSFCIYGTNKGANDSWSSVKVAWTAVGY